MTSLLDVLDYNSIITSLTLAAAMWIIHKLANIVVEQRSHSERIAKEQEEHSKTIEAACVYNMRNDLRHDYRKFMRRGYATYEERKEWQGAYEVYEKLCTSSGQKNGVMEELKAEIEELPTEKVEL